MKIPNASCTSLDLKKTLKCWTSLSKASWRKEDVKERVPKGAPKTLMPPIKVQKHMAQDPHTGELNT